MFEETATKQHRILDFDIENRPLSYWFDGRCTAEVTAICVSWIGEPYTPVACLGDIGWTVPEMLEWFVMFYNDADVVTGHYVRRHDLPIINGQLLEHGMPPLEPKLVSDTKLDLVKRGDIATSQEALGAMLGLDAPKQTMTQADWREANRLTPKGIAETKRRVVGDVIQHKQLRAKLVELGWLGTPRMWRP